MNTPPEKPARMARKYIQQFVKDAGLGNQCFEFAMGYGIAKRMGLEFSWHWNPSKLREFELGAFGIEERQEDFKLVASRLGQGNIKHVREIERRIEEADAEVVGACYPAQCEDCFSDYADEIREIFKLDPLPLDIPEGKTPVAVQVRRGDYVGHSRLEVAGVEYFLNAINWMRRNVENPMFVMLSDDPAWCKATFGHLPNITIMPPQSSIDGLRTMISCESHIISNSTFGWWGAWLGEKGPVVVPEIWHHQPGSYGQWEIRPDRWHRVSIGTIGDGIKPTPFTDEHLEEPRHKRAIVIPWHAEKATWHELRFTLRSIDKFFEDKDCPIYILGTRRPPWLLMGEQRVRYVNQWSYQQALVKGCQLADKVLWMNDDTTLIKPTTWADCEQTLYLRDVAPGFIDSVERQPNLWRAGCVKILQVLQGMGITNHKVFSTHTPYVFEREKAIETFRAFGTWDKMAFEIAYFHMHAKNPVMSEGHVTHGLPFGESRFLNYTDKLLTVDLKQGIKDLLPNFAPWELEARFTI